MTLTTVLLLGVAAAPRRLRQDRHRRRGAASPSRSSPSCCRRRSRRRRSCCCCSSATSWRSWHYRRDADIVDAAAAHPRRAARPRARRALPRVGRRHDAPAVPSECCCSCSQRCSSSLAVALPRSRTRIGGSRTGGDRHGRGGGLRDDDGECRRARHDALPRRAGGREAALPRHGARSSSSGSTSARCPSAWGWASSTPRPWCAPWPSLPLVLLGTWIGLHDGTPAQPDALRPGGARRDRRVGAGPRRALRPRSGHRATVRAPSHRPGTRATVRAPSHPRRTVATGMRVARDRKGGSVPGQRRG